MQLTLPKKASEGFYLLSNPVWEFEIEAEFAHEFLKTDPMDLPIAPSLLLEIIVTSYTT